MTRTEQGRGEKYPTKSQISTLVTLMNWGADALNSHPGTTRNMYRLSELSIRVGMPDEYRAILHQSPRSWGDGVVSISPTFTEGLYTRCRLAGCIMRDGVAAVPLTGLQAYVLKLICTGMSTELISQETGLRPGTVREVMYRARNAYGCSTTPQLVATAYREGWLPGVAEISRLTLRMRACDEEAGL
jgi:DNA-binding CsgD family transcriptional regulator